MRTIQEHIRPNKNTSDAQHTPFSFTFSIAQRSVASLNAFFLFELINLLLILCFCAPVAVLQISSVPSNLLWFRFCLGFGGVLVKNGGMPDGGGP